MQNNFDTYQTKALIYRAFSFIIKACFLLVQGLI